MIIFAFPETKYHRPHPDEIPGPTTRSYDGSNSTLPVPDKLQGGHVEDIEIQQIESKSGLPELSATKTADRDPFLGKGYPSKAQWKLWQSNEHPWKSMAIDLWLPWKLFAFPIVEFAAFVCSWSCSSFLTLNLTQAQAFAAPPYNFSSESIGFFNFAILIGAIIGLATSGKLSDWVAARATKRNGGIREVRKKDYTYLQRVLLTCIARDASHRYDPLRDSNVHRQHRRRHRHGKKMALASHRRNRLRRRRHASRFHPLHRIHLRRRFLQARRRPPLRRHHRKQERVGLRFLQIHHTLGGEVGIHSSHHDEWIFGVVVVFVWRLVLL